MYSSSVILKVTNLTPFLFCQENPDGTVLFWKVSTAETLQDFALHSFIWCGGKGSICFWFPSWDFSQMLVKVS